MLVPFVGIFSEFDGQEDEAEKDRDQEQNDQRHALTFARGVHAHGHGEAAGQENKRHGSAKVAFQSMAACSEAGVIHGAIHDIGGE